LRNNIDKKQTIYIMSQQVNFNNLIDLFQYYTKYNLQLKRFGNGTIPQLERIIADKAEFPMLWANLTNISYPYDNVKQFNFNILVFDLLMNDESNQNDIWNDSIMILEDFIKFLQWNCSTYYRVNFGSQLQINPFTEGKTEIVTGGMLQVQIEVDFDGQNNCGIPEVCFPFKLNEVVYPDNATSCINLSAITNQIINYINGGNNIVWDEYLSATDINFISAGLDEVLGIYSASTANYITGGQNNVL
jgi:hypothetical protein